MKRSTPWPLAMILAAWTLIGLGLIVHLRIQTPATDRTPPAAATEERGNDPRERPATSDEPLARSLLEFVQTPWVGDLDGMLERRLIRVLIVPSETMYFLEQGRPRGIVAEFQAALQTFINRRFPPSSRHLGTSVVVVPTGSDDLLGGLLEGRGDIAAGNLTITAARADRFDVSEPIGGTVDEIAVTGPASPALATLDDLAGKEVLVRPSSSYWEHLQRLNAQFAAAGKVPVDLRAAPEQLQDEDLLEMVNAGLAEIVIVDNYKAELWAQVLPDIRLHPAIAVHRGGRFGWMMRANSPRLRETINAFIRTHKAGTTFGNTVIERYRGSNAFVRRATAPKELAKFDRVVDLFRRYGDRYRLDPLLLLAQGYQESRLDQGARSAAGAVGIMQLLPSTGAAMRVGDVRELEPNIHAGAKYLRLLIDRYFADAELDDLNKALFAFAAYNAGPTRIRRLRALTAKRRLDPNTWFDNVELVASEKIGAEPVRYVSNIFKSYVGFKLLAEHREARRQAKAKFAGHSR